jgi:hypothetical protein
MIDEALVFVAQLRRAFTQVARDPQDDPAPTFSSTSAQADFGSARSIQSYRVKED